MFLSSLRTVDSIVASSTSDIPFSVCAEIPPIQTNRTSETISLFDFMVSDFDKDMILASEQGAGIYLQNVTDKVRSKIQSILVEGTKAKKTKGKVFNELWDSQVALNRDWDRVIRTETAYAVNNGLLISELRQEPSDDPIFMKGISAPGACPYCLSLVNEKVVVLVEEAPATGDTIKIDGVEYNTIWPGKSNFGRKARDYWAATIIHPYCRCSWTRWYLELEDLLKETNNL